MQMHRIAARFVLAFALTLGASAAHAQASPNLAGIAHVALRVHDLAASIAFYEKLGFINAFSISHDGAVSEAFMKINNNQFIELYPADAKNTQIGFLHLCFEGDDLQSAHDFYVAQGLKPGEVAIHGAGNRLFTMPGPASPTGSQNIEYTQYMPGSYHVNDLDRHMGQDRISVEMTSVALAVDDPAAARTFYVNKLKFTPAAGSPSGLTIPGEPSESVDIVPSKSLGFKARMTFQADLAKAAALLKTSTILFEQTNSSITFADPDANQIVLVALPVPAAKP